jgi:hypothetical protein
MVLAIVVADRGGFMVISVARMYYIFRRQTCTSALKPTWCIFAHLCMCVSMEAPRIFLRVNVWVSVELSKVPLTVKLLV